jgi:hypothetical protein
MLSLLLTARTREMTLARLATMGLRRWQAQLLLAVETLPPVVAAAIGGVACAWLLAPLVGPSLNLAAFRELRDEAETAGLRVQYLLTACGTCRDSLERHEPDALFPGINRQDAVQLALSRLEPVNAYAGQCFLYHTACHMEWVGLHASAGHAQIAAALEAATGAVLRLSPGCCGESGMGAFTSPEIYNTLRARKRRDLEERRADCGGAVLVGCPSCKVGIGRTLLAMQDKRPVLHLAEWLAVAYMGEDWRQQCRRKINEAKGPVRVVEL